MGWLPNLAGELGTYGVALCGLLAAVVATGLATRGDGDRRALALVGVAAVAFGAALWPWWRHEFDGQTLFLLESWDGSAPLDGRRSPLIVPPLMEGVAAALGRLGAPAGALVGLAMLAGGVIVAGFAGAAKRLSGSWVVAGAVAVALALDPQRLAWSHAGYHVAHPAAAVALAAWLLAGRRRDDALGAGLAAGLWLGVAAGLRLDALTAAAPLAALAWLSGGRAVAGLVAGAAVSVLPALAYRADGALAASGWGGAEMKAAFAAGVGALELWSPWMGLAGGAAAALLLFAGRERRAWLLLAGVVVAWVGLATFGDLGARHTLALRGFLALALVLAAQLGARRSGAGQLAVGAGSLALGLALLAGAAQLRSAAYAPAPREQAPSWAQGQPSAPPLAESLGCGFVSHNAEQFAGWRPGDHLDLLELLDPVRAEAAWERFDGCVIWLRDHDDQRWDETVRHARSQRLANLWTWQRLGVQRDAFGGWVQVWRWAGPSQPRGWGLRAARAVAPEWLGLHGDRQRCLGAAAATCRWIANCAPDEDAFHTGDDCRQVLEARCAQGAPACPTAGTDCADRAAAEACWSSAVTPPSR